MLIKAHQKTYSVELQDGSRWWIWPADMYGTLRWSPSTDLRVVEINDIQDGTLVRVISADADWIPKRMCAIRLRAREGGRSAPLPLTNPMLVSDFFFDAIHDSSGMQASGITIPALLFLQHSHLALHVGVRLGGRRLYRHR